MRRRERRDEGNGVSGGSTVGGVLRIEFRQLSNSTVDVGDRRRGEGDT
jgi:hypothetical protein